MKDRCFKTLPTLMAWVEIEHNRQISKWGIQDLDSSWWMAFLTEEVGELAQAISEHHFRNETAENIFKEAIQVATLALKIAEMSQEAK